MRKAKGILLLLILAFSLSTSVSISPFKPAQAQEEECLKIYYDSEKGYYYFLTLNRERVVLERSGFAVLNRWDGEAWINFGSFPSEGEIEIEVEAELVENKLKWKGKWKFELEEVEIEIELEPKNISEYGDLEWSMKLTDKPPINVFSMPIQSENLKFYYQPPLYEEYGFSEPFSNSTFLVNATHVMELVNGTWITTTYRPENVVGSYAVYHAYKMNNEYKTGKAFHIYRPKIIDAEGKTAWANLNIDEKKGVLMVTIPQEFLDKAVYPVVIDPTFGYETAGASRVSIAWGGEPIIPEPPQDSRAGTAWTMPEDGNAESITAYLGGDAACDVKAFINQKDSEGANSHGQIAMKEKTDVPASPHWETFTLDNPVTLTDGVDYILNVFGDGSSIPSRKYYYLYYDADGVTSYQEAGNYLEPENPWNVSPESTPKKYSIYCTYTAAAGDTTPPTYSNIGANTTIAGQPCLFHCLWTDDVGLGGFIFSWNASGSWQNETWTSLTGTSAWANVTKTLPSSHVIVGYRWYCNDTSNNWNDTGIQFLQVVVSFQETIQETINVSGILMKQIKTLQTQIVALPDSSNKLTHILNIESLLSSYRIIKKLTVVKIDPLALPETMTKSISIFKTDSVSFLDRLFKRVGPFFYEKVVPEQAGFTDIVITHVWTPWYNDPVEFMKVILFGFCMALLAYWIVRRL